ncbi:MULTISPECIES: HlyD family secretion protein [unclassified Rhizobium]|uniref:HlyD family secretion protein n=1 Tax=unclassified Rhizobium TaxID=2613769 RepID=UPI00160C20B3|nr:MULTISPECIES: HlyD family secretion protein [unclassified Rhizobium]MBB3285316.1 membrane fusion protein (multidrug efflux system) [Rhizobium sp. BK252]MBB3400055.1 membrane fusion protein (multidrug efflux system) [Rhizobium sp. BK289]MBB3412635.1 membrane fusion protein (multidrug efflux system) [Rhizobium sp. BK284]MBB3480521.1 membrane fusion protein (multidrug efflux system) [Rhizobium sp. BK347]MDK4719187.1 HlyD family secretion protein [Rhizobium sp. CNPSo 3968]
MADNQPDIMETKPDRRKQRPVENADRRADSSVEKRPSLVRRHPFWILSGIVVLAALIVGAWFGWKIYFYPYESTDDAFVAARSFSVAAKVSGYVAEVPVTDNQHVAAGDVILRIEPRDYQIALDQANGQVEVAKAAVDSAGAQIEAANASVDVARAQQNSAAAALQYAQQESARQQQLVKSGSGSVQAVQQAASTLQQDQASLAQMQANVTSALKNKTVAEAQKSSALASLKQAEAQAEEAQQNLSYTTITAAQPGRVVRLTGAKGQYIDAGQAISTFVPDEIWITANFKETQLTDMRPGQPVELTIDAYPDHKLHGKVASVQPGSGTAFSLLPAENATGNYVKVTQRVPVKIMVDKWPADVAIGPGMSVVPSVTVRPRS